VVTAADGTVDVLPLPLPHGHPMTHGQVLLRVGWDAGDPGSRRVRSAEAVPGAVHRGAEKLLEMRDYRQGAVLLDRHDWWGAFAGEWGYVLAVERMTGIPVPARAQLLRVVLAELTRCGSHLAFLAGACEVVVPGSSGPVLAGVGVVRDLVEAATGQRVHPMVCRVGGLALDVPDGWEESVSMRLPEVTAAAAVAREVLAGRGEGVAVLATAAARAHAATGPVGRASGRDLDLRRDDPYGAYADVFEASDVVTATDGDAAARWSVLITEVGVSRRVVLRAFDRLVPGPVQARVPRTLRVPEGACWVWTETPQGAGGYFLVSRGGTSPHRVAVRSATFATASAWSSALLGTLEADLPTALASLPVLSGDIDR
jgi:NADH-quinone oxidoreductase subunit D